MAKHNKVVIDSELEEPLVEMEEVAYTKTRALLQLRYPVNVRVVGQATGELYRWTSMGQKVSVAQEDLAQLTDMKLGVGGCCGSAKQANHLFELVEGE